MDRCWGGFLPCLLYYSISSGSLVDLTKLHDWHFINIYWKNILCIFVSLLAPFPPSFWLFPVKKNKNVATNFYSLNSFHPTTKCNSCILSYPKKSFSVSILLNLLAHYFFFFTVKLQESSMLYLSSLLLHLLILQLLVNWIFSYHSAILSNVPGIFLLFPNLVAFFLSPIFPRFLCFI